MRRVPPPPAPLRSAPLRLARSPFAPDKKLGEHVLPLPHHRLATSLLQHTRHAHANANPSCVGANLAAELNAVCYVLCVLVLLMRVEIALAPSAHLSKSPAPVSIMMRVNNGRRVMSSKSTLLISNPTSA